MSKKSSYRKLPRVVIPSNQVSYSNSDNPLKQNKPGTKVVIPSNQVSYSNEEEIFFLHEEIEQS